MAYFLLLLAMLSCVSASPASKPHLSIFDDSSIPVVNQPELGLFNYTVVHERDLNIEKRALNLAYILFDIVFDGLNQGNQLPFKIQGEMLLVQGIPSLATTNGQNPIDVVISVGTPYNSPVAGSIRYVTNKYLNPFLQGSRDTSRTDFARVSATATTVTVSIDTSNAATNQLSVFNARSGITAHIFTPISGGFNIILRNNGQISGRIDLVGRGVGTGDQAPYRAIIGGKAKQRGTFTL